MGAWGDIPGPGGGGTTSQPKSSYVGIASLNTSVRDNKNLLEIRLDRSDFNVSFNLNQAELDHLLTRLGIDSSHFVGVSCCPEGKGVVYVTLHPSVNIQRFLSKSECFELKLGIRTGIIRPAGKKEQAVTISGLHPNTKDQAVVKYLSAHGKVSSTDRVIHHIYPGAVGSSLCAGKLNGNRTYMVEVTKPMGSYHIIDGEKVSVRYRGQDKTCAKCHKTESVCPGRAMARDCTSDRVMLSCHMKEHWEKVGYRPDNVDLNDVDDLDIQIGRQDPEPAAPAESLRPDHSSKYKSVIIKGFSKSEQEQDVYNILLEGGLPTEYKIENIKKNDKNGHLLIDDLDPTVCVKLTNHIHGNKFFNRKVFVTSIVEKTPEKSSPGTDVEPADSSGSESFDDSETDDVTTVAKEPCTKLFSNMTEPSKRPAEASPEVSSEKVKKKKKKKQTGAEPTLRSSSRHGKNLSNK